MNAMNHLTLIFLLIPCPVMVIIIIAYHSDVGDGVPCMK